MWVRPWGVGGGNRRSQSIPSAWIGVVVSPRRPTPAVPLLRYLQPPPLFEGKYLGGGGRRDVRAAEPTARSS